MKNGETKTAVCPLCGKPYTGVPALSRTDNETPICPDCGTRQALERIGVKPEEREEILAIIHAHTDGENSLREDRTMTAYMQLLNAEKSGEFHTIEIREKATGTGGVANIKDGMPHLVEVFYGAEDGSDDKTITADEFSRDFEITALIGAERIAF